nr:DUF6884 domain-containing protein [Halorussus aquaticus]
MESVLFEKARNHCERFHDSWYVLSAKHGLLEPDGSKIEPYDLALSDLDAEERRKWGSEVVTELRQQNVTDDRLVIHAGKDYYEPLLEALGEVEYEIPTEGLRYGESLAWYNEQIEDL